MLERYNIRAVVDVRTNTELTLLDAIKQGLFAQHTGSYIHPVTGEVIPLEKAVAMGLVLVDRPMSRMSEADSEIFTMRSLFERTTISIKGVIDPNTRENLHPNEAINRGILDLDRGLYINPRTGESMSLHEAYDRGLIIAKQTDETDTGRVASVTGTLERKSFNIRAVIDTRSGEEISVEEAMNRGIIDREICSYTNLRTREVLTIQQAIDRGLILVGEGRPLAGTVTDLLETKSFTIKSVIDPRTGEEIPIADAVRHKIVDKNKGEYLNLQTDEIMPITLAIEKGLVITEPIELAGRSMAIVGVGKTRVYNLKSVQDRNTGVWYDPIEAERRGLTNRIQGLYINPITGDTMTIKQAIERGFIKAEILEEPDYAELPQDATIYATMEAVRESEKKDETENIHIYAITDLQTGEELSLMEALRRGLLDPKTGSYRNPLTGEVFSMQEAIDRQLIRAQTRAMTPAGIRRATARGSASPGLVRKSPGVQRKAKTPDTEAQIRGVFDPHTGREIPLNDAVSHGIVDFVSGMYVNTVTGERIPLDRALQQGLVRKEGSPFRDVTPTAQPVTTSMATHVAPVPQMAPMPQMQPMGQIPQMPPMTQAQGATFTEYHYETSRSMASHQVSRVPASTNQQVSRVPASTNQQVSRVPASPQHQVSRVPASTPVSETPYSASAVQSVKIEQQQSDSHKHSVQQSFLGVGPASTDPGGTLTLTYTEAVHKGLIDVQHQEFTDPRTGDRMPVDLAIRRRLLTDQALEESTPEDSLDDSSEMLDRGTISADDEGESLYSRDSTLIEDSSRYSTRERVHSPARDQRSLVRVIPAGQPPELTITEALERGLIDIQHQLYTDPITGDKIPVQDALDAGLLGVVETTKPGYSIKEAIDHGLLDPNTGNYLDPQTGRIITMDEAILLGLINLRCRSVSPAEGENKPKSMSFTEALQKGYLDPVNGTFHDPVSGKTMQLDDAVIKGLLQPVLPSAAGDDPRHQKEYIHRQRMETTVRTPQEELLSHAGASGPTNGYPSAAGAAQNGTRSSDSMLSDDSRDTPDDGFTSPVLNGKGGSPSSSAPSSVGEALSDITPAQYVTKPGFKITPDGTVVNLHTGDVMSITTALDRGYVIDKSLSEKDTDFTSDVSSIGVSSTVSSIYDRVSTKRSSCTKSCGHNRTTLMLPAFSG